MIFRDATVSDAAAWAEIFHAAVHQIACRDYSPEQRRAWSPQPPPLDRVRAHLTDGRSVLVAELDGTVCGFIELERDGHIGCFYCHPQVSGRGVGLALYQRLEDMAQEWRLPGLHVEASETARRFFERQGFEVTTRRDFLRNGVAMHNYAMRKRLTSGD